MLNKKYDKINFTRPKSEKHLPQIIDQKQLLDSISKIQNLKRTKIKDIVRPDYSQLELTMILSRLALPMEKRTGFLRRRLPNGGSCL